MGVELKKLAVPDMRDIVGRVAVTKAQVEH
jgi:hypothetical protein